MFEVIEDLAGLRAVLDQPGHVLVVFTQPSTCVPCRALKPHLEKFVLKHAHPTVAVVDLDKVPDAMVEYDLRSVPNLQLFVNGEYVRTLPQQMTVLKLEKELCDTWDF